MKPKLRRRLVQTLSGTVSYVDSGYSAEEWRAIEDAMSRYHGPSEPNPYPDTSSIREAEGGEQGQLFSLSSFPVQRTH